MNIYLWKHTQSTILIGCVFILKKVFGGTLTKHRISFQSHVRYRTKEKTIL